MTAPAPTPFCMAPGTSLLQADFDAVEGRAGAAESEHAGSARGIVTHQRRRHRDRFDLGKRDFVAVLVPRQIGIVESGQHRGDQRGYRRRRHDVDLSARMAPDRQPFEIIHKTRRDVFHGRRFIRQACRLRCAVIKRFARTEHRHFALETNRPGPKRA